MSAFAHKPARVSIAVGALTMVFGALLAFAPVAGASHGASHGHGHGQDPALEDEDEQQRKLDICHRTKSETNPYTQISVNISSTDGSLGNDNGHGQDHTGHTDDIIPEYTFGDIVIPGQNWTSENQAIWENGCAIPTVEPTPEATLTVVKEVSGVVPDGGWSFDFSVSGEEDDVTLTDAFDSRELTVTPGEYEIVELDDGDATFVSFECTDDNDLDAAPIDVSEGADDPAAVVELTDGDAVTCTFVNDFPSSVVTQIVPGVTPPGEPSVTPPAVSPEDESTPPVQESPPAVDIGEPDLVEAELVPVEVEAEETEVDDEDELEVLGKTVSRTLPRTGSAPSRLALFGLSLILFGGVLTLTSRRRTAVVARAPRIG